MSETILIICPRRPARLIQAMSAMAAVRAHHKAARIVGIVAPESLFIAKALPYLDDTWLDPRTSLWDIRGTWELRAELRSVSFTRIYDFEHTRVSALYFRLMFGWRIEADTLSKIPWSGDVVGTALYHDKPRKAGMHVLDRLQDQLRAAGVYEFLPADVSWAARQVRDFSAPFRMNQPFAIVCLDTESGEAWPVERYAALAEWLASRKLTPLLVGFAEHMEMAERISQRCSEAIDISGKAPVIDTIFLAWAAVVAVGGDCAAMHLAAAANCRSIVLFGAGSDPAVHGPRGGRVQVLHRARLSEIQTPEILALLGDLGLPEA